MAIVARRNAVVGFSGQYLLCFDPAVCTTCICISGLQKAAPAAAAIIIRLVGNHIDKILFSHDRFDDKPQIFRDGIAITFSYDLAWILNRKLDL